MHLRSVAAEFESSNAARLRHVKAALAIDADVLDRFKRKAQEIHFFLEDITDPMAKEFLQELADSYERLWR
jgi:hypothetical protein